ncbi:MAG: hypothetical protein FWF53_06090 [Candidatus Azobacteroides sp.]|nr:hypothetical protein [Candidatus Azobacteroides sp.]
MTIEQINRLLEKYWAGDTSLEEESALKTFFSRDSIPEDLRKYKPLFSWKTNQLQIKGNHTLTGFNKPVRIQWYSILKIAASFLLVITLGIGIYTHYQQEKYLDKIFSETYSNPEDALQETKNVIGKISSALNLAKDVHVESQKLDSLEQTITTNVE